MVIGKVLKDCSEIVTYLKNLIICNTVYQKNESQKMSFHSQKYNKVDINNYLHVYCLVMKLFERILKEGLLLRTSDLLDSRQDRFLNLKSCSTNMVNLTD